jgi:heme exporter protein D
MNWNSPTEFFAMGGYAFYVWGSFGAAAAALAIEIALLRKRRREVMISLRREHAAQALRGTGIQ